MEYFAWIVSPSSYVLFNTMRSLRREKIKVNDNLDLTAFPAPFDRAQYYIGITCSLHPTSSVRIIEGGFLQLINWEMSKVG
jgi:hypothetical protein